MIDIIEYNNITPVICISKYDLLDDTKEIDEIINYYKSIGYSVFINTEIDKIRKIFKDKVSILTGQTGVGKSSLINKLEESMNLKTNEISKALGRGITMYSEKVMDHFQHPRNMGEIEDASGVGTVGNAKCGDIMRIYLDIDDETHIIRDCKFKTFGCGAAVATSSMATEMVMGKTIEEAMEVTNKAVMEALDGLPPVKVHCSLLAEEAIHAALWDYAEKHHIEIKGLQKPVSDISEHEEDEEY